MVTLEVAVEVLLFVREKASREASAVLLAAIRGMEQAIAESERQLSSCIVLAKDAEKDAELDTTACAAYRCRIRDERDRLSFHRPLVSLLRDAEALMSTPAYVASFDERRAAMLFVNRLAVLFRHR